MTVADAASVATARYGRGPLLGAIVVAFGWHVGNDLTGTLLGWPEYRSAAVVLAVWISFAIVGVLAAAATLRHTSRGAGWPAIGIAVLLAGVVAQSASSTPKQTFLLDHWAWANFGWFAALVLWRRPIPWLMAAMGLNFVVALTTLMLTRDMDRVDLARFATVVYGASAIQLGVAWGGRALENRAGLVARAASERAGIVIAQAAAQRVHQDRQLRYREIGLTARQLLAELSKGELDPGEARVRHRCAIEASRLRRLIAEHDEVPSRLLHELRACADVAERRGVLVELETVGTPSLMTVEIRRSLTEVPIYILASARTYARLTVIFTPELSEVSIVADADFDEAAAPVALGVETLCVKEGGVLWVRTRWRAR